MRDATSLESSLESRHTARGCIGWLRWLRVSPFVSKTEKCTRKNNPWTRGWLLMPLSSYQRDTKSQESEGKGRDAPDNRDLRT